MSGGGNHKSELKKFPLDTARFAKVIALVKNYLPEYGFHNLGAASLLGGHDYSRFSRTFFYPFWFKRNLKIETNLRIYPLP